MKKMSTSDARNQFAEIVNSAAYGKERVVITKNGKNAVALVPIEDLEVIEAIENKIDLEDAKEALLSVKKEGTVSWDTIKKRLGL